MRNKLLIIISLFFVILIGLQTPIFAATESEVKNQINDINKQIEVLDKEIAKYQAQLNETGQQKNTLNNTIKELTLTRSKLITEKNQIQKKINATGLVIKEISGNIENKEDSIQKSEESLKKRLYSLYQLEKYSFVEMFLSQEKLEEFSKEYNNTLSINESVRNYIKELLNEKKELSNSKIQKINEQDKLNTLKQTLLAKETAVLNTKKEKDALLIQTKNKEAEYQKILAEQIKKRDIFEKELSEYEDKLKFILNPKLLPKEGSEVLSWPLDSVLITSLFGKRWGRIHGGVDFRASIGTVVKSVSSGTVLGFGDTDLSCKGASFGKWILIKHENGLSSVYAHLSVINVKNNQKVNTGDIVGLSGNTGSSTAPHLHLGIYASDGVNVDTVPSKVCDGKIFTQPIAATNAYLNPLLYLPKTTQSMYKAGVL